MSLYEKHVFVCQNERPVTDERGSCSQKGSVDFRSKLKAEIKSRRLQHKIRINASGCLGTCQHGISMVIYPQGIWYGQVSETDIPEIIEKSLLNDEIIDRLLMPFMQEKKTVTVKKLE